mgnify:CR=1 FL=1
MSYNDSPHWIDTPEQLTELINLIGTCERLAIDTEFHGERTYIPRLMLLQLATEDQIFLIDPLADVDLCALFTAIVQPGGPLVVGHALHNDLEIVYLRGGHLLPRVFDTQIGAAFLGFGLQVGLANLVSRVCGERLPKDGQMADWSRRPLSDKLCEYAANDVRYLLEVHTKLTDDLNRRERGAWVDEECGRLSDETRYQRKPELAYKRVSKYRTLKPSGLGVLQAIAAERDLLASELDMVPHFVVSDDILLTLARSTPTTRAELNGHRRLKHRQVLRNADRWLAAIRRGQENPLSLPKARPPTDGTVDAASTLVMLLVSELARQNEMASQLLIKRTVVQIAMQDGFSTREELFVALNLVGWRAELVGEPIWLLLNGELRAACEYRDGSVRVGFEGRDGRFIEIKPRDHGNNGRRRHRSKRHRVRPNDEASNND